MFFSLGNVQKWGKGADSVFCPLSQNIKVKGPSSHLPNGDAAEGKKVAEELEQGV